MGDILVRLKKKYTLHNASTSVYVMSIGKTANRLALLVSWKRRRVLWMLHCTHRLISDENLKSRHCEISVSRSRILTPTIHLHIEFVRMRRELFGDYIFLLSGVFVYE